MDREGGRRWGISAGTLTVLAAGALLSLLALALWEPLPVGIWHDDGVYVLLGRALAHGEGLRLAGVAGAPPSAKFPPLYPLLLAVEWRFGPPFPEVVALFEVTNLLLVAFGGAAFLAFLHRGLGLSPGWAAGVTGVAWLSPALWRLGAIPLSEPLFILLLAVALLAGTRAERGEGGVGAFLVLALLAWYTRSAGIALAGAGVLALLLRGRRRAGTLLAAGLLLGTLPWLVWSARATARIDGPLRDLLGSYGGWILRQVREEPVAYAASVLKGVPILLGEFTALLLPGLPAGAWWAGLLLLPLLLAGVPALHRTSRTASLTLWLYLLVVLLWPFRAARLLTPVLPLLVLLMALGVRAGLRRFPGRDPRGLAAAGFGLVWLGFFLLPARSALLEEWPPEAYRVRSRALEEGVRAVLERTPPDAVVGAPELWAGLHLYTGRTVAPSARFLPLSRRGPSWGTPREQYRLWAAAGIDHVLVEHAGGVHGEALDRVDALCPPGTVQVLDMVPGQFLVRLAWDEACRRKLMEPRS